MGEDVYGKKSRAKDKLPSIDIGNGWYLRAHMGNPEIRQHTETACNIDGFNYGEGLDLWLIT